MFTSITLEVVTLFGGQITGLLLSLKWRVQVVPGIPLHTNGHSKHLRTSICLPPKPLPTPQGLYSPYLPLNKESCNSKNLLGEVLPPPRTPACTGAWIPQGHKLSQSPLICWATGFLSVLFKFIVTCSSRAGFIASEQQRPHGLQTKTFWPFTENIKQPVKPPGSSYSGTGLWVPLRTLRQESGKFKASLAKVKLQFQNGCSNWTEVHWGGYILCL